MFVYPKLNYFELGFVRLGGSGLGNILFPWARAQLLARNHSLKLIEPTWPGLSIGPLVRGQSDLRLYFDLFNPQANSVKYLNKLKLLSLARHITEHQFLKETKHNSGTVVIATGKGNYFQDIKQDYRFIRQQLISITKEKHRKGLDFDFSDSIVMHIRRGDFKVGSITTPLHWYINIIKTFRQYTDRLSKVYIFSDGTASELAPILNMPGVVRLGFGSSIADILAMSKAPIFVGSKYSTFSLWSAYLGRMPMILPFDENYKYLYGSAESSEILSLDGCLTREEVSRVLPSCEI